MIDPSERGDNAWPAGKQPPVDDNPATSHFDFRAAVRVWDPRQLYRAACDQMAKEWGETPPTPDDFVDVLGDPDTPDLGACIVMLLDQSAPGMSIEESTAEQVEVQ